MTWLLIVVSTLCLQGGTCSTTINSVSVQISHTQCVQNAQKLSVDCPAAPDGGIPASCETSAWCQQADFSAGAHFN